MKNTEIEKEIEKKQLNAPRVTFEFIQSLVIDEAYYVFPGTTVTICLLTLKNGYTTTGKSACVSIDNFNEELGRKIAKDNAIDEIWQLEGYLLKQKEFENL